MDRIPTLDVLRNGDEGVKHICVIGGGAGGLAALKIIADTPQYKAGLWKPVAFEKRERIGGIWLPAPPTEDPPLTPQYDSLTTNLPHPIMAFPSFPFPPSTPLYPHAPAVLTYLDDYAANFNLNQHIRLNTAVTRADWVASASKWHVETSDGQGANFDLLIVANGHYTVPRYPDTPGLAAWRAQGKASHSAWYRRPDNYGQTILVVGAGPSGKDVALDMRRSHRTVVHSMTDAAHEDLEGGALKQRGRIAAYLDPAAGRVRFEDGSEEAGIDHCVLATGYQYAVPFLAPRLVAHALPHAPPPLPAVLHNSTYHLFPLARHLFPLVDALPPHALAFLGLPMRIAPLPLLEAQARATVALFADPARLDRAQEAAAVLEKYEELRGKTDGSDRAVAAAWTKFGPGEQFEYRDALHAFAGGEYAREEWKVPAWTKELYYEAFVMRAEWEDIEKAGEAEEWLRGVGENAMDGDWSDWIELMRRVLRRAEDRNSDSLKYRMRL